VELGGRNGAQRHGAVGRPGGRRARMNVPTRKIRVVIAEDQEMMLGALAALLDMEDDITVVAQARNGKQAVEAVRLHNPDVLITDIEMPEMTGLEAANAIKGGATRVIMVTTFARPGYLRRAMDAGANGYLLKARPAGELADAVRRIHRGLRVIDPGLATEAWAEADPLTDRERQVLRLAAEGVSTGDAAKRLNLSAGTVRNYLSEAIDKLGATNRIDAARIARSKGWL
jgi:two-component system, NarL family, response regulator DesR